MADDWSPDESAATPQKLEDKPTAQVEPKPANEESLFPEEGFGTYLKAQTQPVAEVKTATAPSLSEAPELKAVAEPVIASTRRATSNSPPPTPPPAIQTANSLQKMKDQGMYRNQYFKNVECFDCNHKFKTGRSAKSANCPSCGAYLSLEDFEINMTSTQVIKTRGDILVRKRGHLSTSSVHCRELNCHGIIEANITCSGDAIFRTTGTIIGELHCQRFLVEKGADIVFLNAIHATDIEIQSRITATIFCTGPVLIASNGSVNGDVTARSVSIEPGGELNGAMNIVRGKPTAPPAPTGS